MTRLAEEVNGEVREKHGSEELQGVRPEPNWMRRLAACRGLLDVKVQREVGLEL